MTEPPGQDQPEPPSDGEGDEAPLTLADTNEGSTDPVLGARAAVEASSKAGSSSGSSLPIPPEGSSTGGFETMLGKLVVERGLVVREEIDLCATLLGEGSSGEEPRTLSDVLVDNGFVTRRQLDRLRREFEARKSTQQIPGFQVKQRIGSGAMATVFLARQLSLDRLVAIKVLPRKFSDNAKFIERFYKEGRAAAKLNHPNIVSAYDVGKAGEHHCFVMEYVDGQTIYDRIVKGKRIDEPKAIEIVKQVALALQHAHERGLIHRDIKPKNIMISRQGVVKLADLGLARAMTDKEAAKAEAGRAYGTPYYISPEQIRGEVKIGPAADIYGLGATFYHMVTGGVPFTGKNPSSVMHKHLKALLRPPDHVNPKLSAGCAQVIEMMMAKSARDRYHSAADLLEDLDLISKGQPPHFAHRTLDHVTVASANIDTQVRPVVVSTRGPLDRLSENPALMTVVVILLMSLAANAVMLLLRFG